MLRHAPQLGGGIGAVMAHVQSGRVTPLAVGAPKRLPMLPQVPTAVEAGYPQLVAVNVYGLFGPAGLPKELSDKLHAALEAIVADPAIAKRFEELGITASTASAFGPALAVMVVPSSGSSAMSIFGPVPCAPPTFSPMNSMGASSRSPSPITTVPPFSTSTSVSTRLVSIAKPCGVEMPTLSLLICSVMITLPSGVICGLTSSFGLALRNWIEVAPLLLAMYLRRWWPQLDVLYLAVPVAGALVLVPLILAYTAYSYWVFRGKVDPEEGYH